jgi:hypothetical protein
LTSNAKIGISRSLLTPSFLVQSIKITADLLPLPVESATPRLAELWSIAEAGKKDGAVAEQKLKCVFLPVEVAEAVKQPAANPAEKPVAVAASGDAKESEAIKRLTLACEGYKLEIDRLNGLRQRGGGGGSGGEVKVKTVVSGKTVQKEGMSVQIAAIIAVVAFFLGVLLF